MPAPVPPTAHPRRHIREKEGWQTGWLDDLDAAYIRDFETRRAQMAGWCHYWDLVDRVLEEVPAEEWRAVIDGNPRVQEAWADYLVLLEELTRARKALDRAENARERAARRIRSEVRRAVIAEWEENGRVCGICNKVVAEGEKFHVHHIKPVYRGGTADRENLTVAHASCNVRDEGYSFPSPRRITP